MELLTRDECRVLGVLIEKAQTVPSQYPMSLRDVVVASGQKTSRDPVYTMDEDQAVEALDGLRRRELVRQVTLPGSRVDKYRHIAREALEIETIPLVILAELLLRGPQTLGELRGRASRMADIPSLDVAQNALDEMRRREPPLVRLHHGGSGERAARYVHLLGADQPEVTHGPNAPEQRATPPEGQGQAASGFEDLAARVARLEAEVQDLRNRIERSNPAARPVQSDADEMRSM